MSNRYAVRYKAPDGRTWHFTGQWLAGIKSGGIDDLIGDGDDVTHALVGAAGQTLDSIQPKPMTGTLTLHVRGDDNRTADDVWADLRRDFHRHTTGKLTIATPTGDLTAAVRLSGPIPPPTDDPTETELVRDVKIPLIADRCGWWKPTQTGTVTVTIKNTGDLTIRPRVRWNGNGGIITMFSGAKFTLPSVTSERILYLDRERAGTVETSAGMADYATRDKLLGVLPEGVPAGKTRTMTVPAGATVEWEEGVFDPWQ